MFFLAASLLELTRSLALDRASATAWLAMLPAPRAASSDVRTPSLAVCMTLFMSFMSRVSWLFVVVIVTHSSWW